MGVIYKSKGKGSKEFPALVKFQTAGQYVQGVIKSIVVQKTTYGLKPLLTLTVEDATADTFKNKQVADVKAGEDVQIFPTESLAELLDNVAPGDRVKITLANLIGTGKGNPFKEFTLEVL